jgi:UDP-GlcNAc3NAcA epimerase
MKIVSVVGARPQFIKAAATSRALRERHQEILVHTGQHYDYEMSGIFFEGLGLPQPDVNLGVAPGAPAAQTAAMQRGLEDVLIAERPDWVLVYGDTRSTLAGALAAARCSVPLAHVEAGLRSFNRRMPEEVNRIVADHLSQLLLCPSEAAVRNLAAEGITRHVHLVGDVMLDVLREARREADARAPEVLSRLGVAVGSYVIVTVHRSENTDGPVPLARILEALDALDEPVIFPVHPRARRVIARAGRPLGPHVRLVDPVGYLEMVGLVSSARLVLTDSGGLQKEAYWLGTPCLTLRRETEWVETVQAGWNTLVGADPRTIVQAARTVAPPASRPPLYGNGGAAARCVDLLDRAGQTVERDGERRVIHGEVGS